MTVAMSSNGRIFFCPESGEIYDCEEYPDCTNTLDQITRVDVAKLREVYPEGIPDEVDILECGYWTSTGHYEPPLHWDGEGFVPLEELCP